MESKEQARPRAPGTTSIAPGVLVTIARLSALGVDGVAGMARIPSGMNRLLRRGTGEGVEVRVENGNVSVDLYIILDVYLALLAKIKGAFQEDFSSLVNSILNGFNILGMIALPYQH